MSNTSKKDLTLPLLFIIWTLAILMLGFLLGYLSNPDYSMDSSVAELPVPEIRYIPVDYTCKNHPFGDPGQLIYPRPSK